MDIGANYKKAHPAGFPIFNYSEKPDSFFGQPQKNEFLKLTDKSILKHTKYYLVTVNLSQN